MYVSTSCDYLGAGKGTSLSVLICVANSCMSCILCMFACVCTYTLAASVQPRTDLPQ